MEHKTKYLTGLQKAIRKAARGGADGEQAIADVAGVARKTVVEWVREEGGIQRDSAHSKSVLYKAVTAAGGPSAVASTMGVTPESVRQWIAQGYVPNKRVPEFSIQFGVDRTSILSPKVRSATGMGGEL